MKKKLFVGALVSLAAMPMTVFAGTSTVKFEGQNNVNVGDEFKVNMIIDNVSDTNGGVIAFGGYLSFDSNVLQLVSTESTGNYDVIINNNINKIAAIDLSLEKGIYDRTNVYTITFKAIGEGNTAVTLRNGELCDRNSDLDFTVESLDINTKNVVVETQTVETEKPVVSSNNTYVEEQVKETEVKENTVESNEQVTVKTKEEKVTKKVAKNTKKANKKNKKNTKKNGFVDFFVNIFNKIFKI